MSRKSTVMLIAIICRYVSLKMLLWGLGSHLDDDQRVPESSCRRTAVSEGV